MKIKVIAVVYSLVILLTGFILLNMQGRETALSIDLL